MGSQTLRTTASHVMRDSSPQSTTHEGSVRYGAIMVRISSMRCVIASSFLRTSKAAGSLKEYLLARNKK